MDYKDFLGQSLTGLDRTLDQIRRSNDDIIRAYGLRSGFGSDSDNVPDKGIILTDTARLADAYGCQRSVVTGIIDEYVCRSAGTGFRWYLLDMPAADTPVQGWEDIIPVLAEFNAGQSISTPGQAVPLFIIGGDRIIPMPKIENPTPQVIGGEYLDADYRYAFADGGDGFDYSVFTGPPSYYVGRLPVPIADDGDIDELADYLDRCCEIEEKGGMDIRHATMVSTETWIPSSKDMVSDIPVARIDSSTDLSVEGKLILSPNLDMKDDDFYEEFSAIAEDVDYLVCNLHGSDDPDVSSYLGEDINRTYYPEGLCIDILERNSPEILASTACYGARYVGFGLDRSMLLSALSNGTMLFVGSCIIALGNPEGAGYSEYLVKLLNVYLHQGIPAGAALAKAKRDYYRDKADEEGNVYALFTNLEFNLFGNPLLAMKPILPADYVPKERKRDGLGRLVTPTFKTPQCHFVVRKDPAAQGDILSQVRAEVNRGLEKIARTIQEELYDRLGMQGQELESIIEFGSPGTEQGYYYTFCRDCGQFKSRAIAKTDRNGNIKRIIETK